MKLLKSIVRPNKVDEVKDALAKLNIAGMTVTEVRGHGKQKGHTAIYRGKEYNVSLLPKMEIEVVVADSIADEAIKAIVQAARTGEIGDGRVFVLPVAESYRIRTGEMERESARDDEQRAAAVVCRARERQVMLNVVHERRRGSRAIEHDEADAVGAQPLRGQPGTGRRCGRRVRRP